MLMPVHRFPIQFMKALQACSHRHVCCLGISWQTQQSAGPEQSGAYDVLDLAHLSLDAPEVQLEQALQDRWPVPLVDTAMSMNNAGEMLRFVVRNLPCFYLTIYCRSSVRSPPTSNPHLERHAPESCQFTARICAREQRWCDGPYHLTTQDVIFELQLRSPQCNI
jgi:hypothetical protein